MLEVSGHNLEHPKKISSEKEAPLYRPFKPSIKQQEEEQHEKGALPNLDYEYDKSQGKNIEHTKLSPLSEEDFNRYFNNKGFKQGRLGNCYFVSALRSLMESKYYKNLILSSTSTVKNTEDKVTKFIIKMPLGEPNGKKISVEKDDIDQKQYIIKDGKRVERCGISSGCIGVKVIEAAYNEYILGQDNGRLENMSGGFGSLALINLLGTENAGMFNFVISKQEKNKGGYEVVKMKMTELRPEQIKNILLKFNPNTMLITLNSILKKGGNDSNSYLIHNKQLQHNHAYSLVGVEKEGNTLLGVNFVNPRDTSKIIRFTYEEFIEGFSGISGVALKKTFMNASSTPTIGRIYDVRNRREQDLVSKT